MKVSVLGPEYLDDQLLGGPSHDPRGINTLISSTPTTMEKEVALAHSFESSGSPEHIPHDLHTPQPITASEALRLQYQHLAAIRQLADQFGAKIVDISENSTIVEMSGKTSRVEAFLSLLRPFGILESARTGSFGFELSGCWGQWLICYLLG